jgi:hypothetical protein
MSLTAILNTHSLKLLEMQPRMAEDPLEAHKLGASQFPWKGEKCEEENSTSAIVRSPVNITNFFCLR